uniref:Thyroglobulin type-1 domain-containing protein n=1 Tax=Esox lucius TaxID=8010 RepID=A0A3P8YJ07_ESOLU
MEEQQQIHNEALLERTASDEAILPSVRRRTSNSRAFKVAGFTLLACLLLAGQGLTAYLVFNQRGQINDMQKNNDNMRKQLRNRPPVAPVQMHMPMLNMPRLIDFSEEDSQTTKNSPMTKLENTAVAIQSLEKQVKDLLQNPELPQFNETFLANLQGLKKQMESNEWKDFETWTRNWLIFQMAQEKTAVSATPKPSTGLQTKCSEVKDSLKHMLGTYVPQCDEQGNYLPMQCWHATGFCWCVDKTGQTIPGTAVRGRASCNQGIRRVAAPPMMMQVKEFKEE